MAEITEWVKKIWKNRITEFPTRRELTKEDGSSEIVTVTRNEGTVSEEGDAFDADTMNNLEERIDAGFADVNRKLSQTPILISTSTSGSYTIPASDIDTYKKIQVIAMNTSLNANTEISMDVSVLKELGTDKTYTHMIFSSGSGVGYLTQASIRYTTNGDIECLGMCKGWTLQHIKVFGYM